MKHVFGEIGGEARGPGFLFDEFSVSESDLIGLFYLTMHRSGTDFCSFTDAQICAGLCGLFDPGRSNISYRIMVSGDWSSREMTICSIASLYEGVFSRLCSPALGHLNETGSAINTICYMLWDVSPIGLWVDHPDKEAGEACIAKVMETALSIDHDACRESALHGLGHLAHYRPDLVEPIIADFLRRAADIRAELVSYAHYAALGRVQ